MAKKLVKELLLEMRDHNIRKAENRNAPPFLASTRGLRDVYDQAKKFKELYDKANKFKEIYDKLPGFDISRHARASVVSDLERDITERSLRFSDESRKLANASAKEIEKITAHTDSATRNRIKERLDADRQQNLNNAKDTINGIYESLIQTVNLHPEEELYVLRISDVFLDGFNDIIMKINDFIDLVNEELAVCAERIWVQIEQVYNDVADAINNWFDSWNLSEDQSAGS